MKLNNKLKLTIIAAGLLSLAACSTTGTGSSNNAGGQGNGGVQSYGLGSNGQIQGQSMTYALTTKAPYNQSYYFDFNKDQIHGKYLASMDAQANYLVSHQRASVLLAGNTDARGSHEYNIALGERRALAVANRLEMDGVAKKQIRVVSYGDMKPVALGHTPAAYAKNRRVDLIYEAK